MFEDGFDDEVRAAVAAGTLVLDAVPDTGDQLWDSLTPEELAWLREHPLPEPVADVLAAGVQQPVDAHLIGRLETLDPATLDDAGRVALAVAWQRVATAALARRADAVAALARARQATAWVDGVRAAATELAPALALGTGAADLLATSSVLLAQRLSATLAAVRCGDVSWDKAVTLAQATARLSDEQARAVQARVLPRAGRRTPAQHRDAVRRAVDRVDPDGARRRREQAQADIRLIATHHGAGMGELFACLPSEQLDTVYLAADCHARAAKATGDTRPLDELRVAALVGWAESSLTHGNPTRCDRDACASEASVGVPGDAEVDRAPSRHGRPAVLRVLWDLESLLGITAHAGELAGSGATLPARAVRELLARGARVRRLLIDEHGELVDLTPCSWILPPTGPAGAHLPPVQLQLIVPAWLREVIHTGAIELLDPDQRQLARRVADLLPHTHPVLADLLAYPITAEQLDRDPHAQTPSAALAEFVATRDRHPVNPAAGPTDAAACDLDHTVPRSAGGTTIRDNLTSLTRRWHLARTHGGWTYQRVGRGAGSGPAPPASPTKPAPMTTGWVRSRRSRPHGGASRTLTAWISRSPTCPSPSSGARRSPLPSTRCPG